MINYRFEDLTVQALNQLAEIIIEEIIRLTNS